MPMSYMTKKETHKIVRGCVEIATTTNVWHWTRRHCSAGVRQREQRHEHRTHPSIWNGMDWQCWKLASRKLLIQLEPQVFCSATIISRKTIRSSCANCENSYANSHRIKNCGTAGAEHERKKEWASIFHCTRRWVERRRRINFENWLRSKQYSTRTMKCFIEFRWCWTHRFSVLLFVLFCVRLPFSSIFDT